jgi:hypothetical protein
MGERGYSPALMPIFGGEAFRVRQIFRKLAPICIGVSFTDPKNELE